MAIQAAGNPGGIPTIRFLPAKPAETAASKVWQQVAPIKNGTPTRSGLNDLNMNQISKQQLQLLSGQAPTENIRLTAADLPETQDNPLSFATPARTLSYSAAEAQASRNADAAAQDAQDDKAAENAEDAQAVKEEQTDQHARATKQRKEGLDQLLKEKQHMEDLKAWAKKIRHYSNLSV